MRAILLPIILSIAFVITLSALPQLACAQTVTTLHSFGDGSVTNDGQVPYAPLVQDTVSTNTTYGDFFGTTTLGGSESDGTVYRMTPSDTVLISHSFLDGTVSNDGYDPQAALVQDRDPSSATYGDFFGTTFYGGSTKSSDPLGRGLGTLYRMTPAGTVTILHSFFDGSVTNDGQDPYAALVQDLDPNSATYGDFFGTTYFGGSASGGAIFKMTPSGTVTILHSFGDGTVTNDGLYPHAGLVQDRNTGSGTYGDFFGTTTAGGSASGGAIFKLTASGTVTTIHSFDDGSVVNDGSSPQATLVQGTDGNFYGTTLSGGSTDLLGTIYRSTPAGSVVILHSFGDGTVENDGQRPTSGLIQATDGNFYGTTPAGGSTDTSGTAYEMTTAGQVTILHSFGDGTVENDGIIPEAALFEGTDDILYGTASAGGSVGHGVVFNMTVPTLTALPMPTILPDGGSFAGSVQVTLSDTDTSASILYTTDGTNPATSSTAKKYSTFFTLTVSATVEAVATRTGYTNSTLASAAFTLYPAGSAPTANSQTVQVPFETATAIALTGSDPNSPAESLTFKVTSNPAHGALTGSAPNLTYTPNTGFHGTDSFNFTVTDTSGLTSAPATVTLDVAAGAPTANSQTVPVAYQTPATVTLTGSDPNSPAESLSFTVAANPSDGVLSGTAPNLTYTPDTGFNGTDSFTFTAENTSGVSSAPATVTLNVAAEGTYNVSYPAGLQMFSSPYTYTGISLDTLFGYSGVTLAVWDTPSSQYGLTPTPPANQITLGQGYWVRFPQAITVTAPGTPAPTTQPFVMVLSTGWNMIGDPFQSSVPITSLSFLGNTETFAQATAGGLIGATVYGYSQSTGNYYAATSLAPEQGYWILAFSPTDIQMPAP